MSSSAPTHYLRQPVIVGRKFEPYKFELRKPSYCICPDNVTASREYKNSIKGGCEQKMHDCNDFIVYTCIDLGK